jgi:hypothetical protein
MAKSDVTIKLTLEYDPEENKGLPVNIFLYQMLNRLDYKFPIKAVEYGGNVLNVSELATIKDLPLKKVDSIDKKDLPVVSQEVVTPAPAFVSKRNLVK